MRRSPAIGAKLDDARLLEALQHGLGAEMDLGRRAQEGVDAGFDHAVRDHGIAI